MLATAWDSFGQQAQAFVGAQSHADILGVVVASAEAFLGPFSARLKELSKCE